MGQGAATPPVCCVSPPPAPTLSTGCELSSQQDSYTFQVLEEWQCEQQLALRTVGGPWVSPPQTPWGPKGVPGMLWAS